MRSAERFVPGAVSASRSGRGALDAAMALLLPALMAYSSRANAVHEIGGVLLFVFFSVHLGLNFRWYPRAVSGRKDPAAVLGLAVNLLLLAVLAALALSAVRVSRSLFAFLGLDGGADARRFHVCFAAWAFVLAGFHAGLHGGVLKALLRRTARRRGTDLGRAERSLKTLLRAGAVLAAACGASAALDHGLPSLLVLRSAFAYVDPERSFPAYAASWYAVFFLCAWTGHYALKVLRLAARRRRAIPGERT